MPTVTTNPLEVFIVIMNNNNVLKLQIMNEMLGSLF
jgi:hypothetical protein